MGQIEHRTFRAKYVSKRFHFTTKPIKHKQKLKQGILKKAKSGKDVQIFSKSSKIFVHIDVIKNAFLLFLFYVISHISVFFKK